MTYDEEKCKGCMRRDFCKDGLVECNISEGEGLDITTDTDTETVTITPWVKKEQKEESWESLMSEKSNLLQLGSVYGL